MANYRFVHKVEVIIDDRNFREGEEISFNYCGKRFTGKIEIIDDRHDVLVIRLDEIDYPVRVFKVALMEKVTYIYYD